jgi:hypothetical protein
MNIIWKSVAAGAVVAMIIIGTFFAYQFYSKGPTYVVPPPAGQYVNVQHDFTFTVPEGYEVIEKDNLVVLKDAEGNGLQLVITRLGRDTEVLDEAFIRHDLPDLVIKNPQPVTIAGAGTGLAFRGENPAFEGASRELWFVEDGYLFQLITYDRLAPLLSAIYGTLRFR